MHPFTCVAVAIVVASPAAFSIQSPPNRLPFTCAAFSPTTTETELRARFGSENVSTDSVPDHNGAEGDRTTGTVLFARDPDARLEISWNEPVAKRQPAFIAQRGPRGRWRTAAGITLGTDLKTIEKLNRRPFRLAGMAFDAQGTVMSWSGGLLESQDAPGCHVGIRVRLESSSSATYTLERQIMGDKQFSSGHPAMQALNPTVYELFIRYGRS